ncbi:hypothetical protein V5O48_018661 [Marasmius crinis-equi]|uniref:HAT C-terminal dimerisation domain-containing protein n=1 Tax=Marasmius crinis-equi TaxID=585013 RepID=A0ABR3EKJ0_9AGAR
MHPRYKLAYFRKERWPQDWIDAAVNQQKSVINTVRKSRFLLDDDIMEVSSGDAFDDWITGDIITSAAAKNPILWWSSDYPQEDTWSEPLQQMALDILSCPATSCDAERGFSRGGLMVSKRRYALSSTAIRSALCLSYWVKVPGLIPEAAIIKMFNDKGRRLEGRETVQSIIHRAATEEIIEIEGSGESSSGSESG